MKPQENCPTCGAALGPLHADALRRCDACQKPNPRGFAYCGFCATPMRSQAEQAEQADVAAPPGGWPNLSRELVELRFYMERGELDEAFELLSILRSRHPGHPALTEFERDAQGKGPRPDTSVHRVVDSVLAGSQSLGSAMPRRSVPQWKASEAGSGPDNGTRAHAAVPLGAERQAVRKRIVRTDRLPGGPFVEVEPGADVAEASDAPAAARPTRAKTSKHLGAVPMASSPEPRGAPAPSRTDPNSDPSIPIIMDAPSDDAARRSGPDAITKPEPSPDAVTKPEPVPPPPDVELDAPSPRRPVVPSPGMTIAVPTLQAPAPYQGDPRSIKAVKSVIRKQTLKSRKHTGRQVLAESRGDGEPDLGRRRRRGDSFGQHVLGRLGRKGKQLS